MSSPQSLGVRLLTGIPKTGSRRNRALRSQRTAARMLAVVPHQAGLQIGALWQVQPHRTGDNRGAMNLAMLGRED